MGLAFYRQLGRPHLDHSIELFPPELNAREKLFPVFLLWLSYLAFEGDFVLLSDGTFGLSL